MDRAAEAHHPDLYRHARLAEYVDGFEAIDSDGLACYERDGYLAVQNAFTPSEVRDALQGLLDLIAGKNPSFTHTPEYCP